MGESGKEESGKEWYFFLKYGKRRKGVCESGKNWKLVGRS